MVHSQKALKFILLWRAPKQEFLLKPRGSSTRQSVTLIMWRPSERQFKLLLISWVNPIILIVDWVIPENIHTIPQTYFVFIEMNLQCRQIHVADICLWWDEHTCSTFIFHLQQSSHQPVAQLQRESEPESVR